MVEMVVRYKGDLRTEMTHTTSGTVVETDAPRDNEGRGERFSPTDLMTASLGACALTIMGIAAKKRRIAIDGAMVRVEKHMIEAPRRVGRIVLEFTLPISLPPADRAVLERICSECPVHMSINPDISVEATFVYV